MKEQLRTRAYNIGRDYPELCEWWRARKWKAPPCDSLPSAGVVAEDENGLPHAAAFYYLGEGPWAWCDFVVTNPGAPLRPRVRAVELVIRTVIEEVRHVKSAIGFEPRIITVTGNESLISLFKKHGFLKGDGLMTTLVWTGGAA